MEIWQWPQYLLAIYWGSIFFLAVIVWTFTDMKINRMKAGIYWIGVFTLNVILYFGGFWT